MQDEEDNSHEESIIIKENQPNGSSNRSDRNVLINDNKLIRTYPACLSPNEVRKGYNGTPELHKIHQVEYFQNSLQSDKVNKLKYQRNQYDVAYHKNLDLESKNQYLQERERKGTPLRYQDYKEHHKELRQTYLNKRNQVTVFVQKKQFKDFNCGSTDYYRNVETPLFKQKFVKLSHKSDIQLFTKLAKPRRTLKIQCDDMKVQEQKKEQLQRYMNKQHLIRALSPKAPPVPAKYATNSKKVNRILCAMQQVNLELLQRSILKTINPTPKVKHVLGDRLMLLSVLKEDYLKNLI